MNQPVPYKIVGRRNGDPAVLMADARQARTVLGWEPILNWTILLHMPFIELLLPDDSHSAMQKKFESALLFFDGEERAGDELEAVSCSSLL